MWKVWKQLKKRGVMGINSRNGGYVMRYNRRHLYPLVDDKVLTKEKALEVGIRVPEQYAVIETEQQIKRFSQLLRGRSDFVIKPAEGAGGDGILVITDRFEGMYRTAGGKLLTEGDIEHHLSGIISGIYSLGGYRDKALVEYRVTPDEVFAAISYEGVPDIRLIVLRGYPVMAMLRLPTRQSQGKANLHQGAIGVGVDLATGITISGTWHNRIIHRHPDTTNPVAGVQLPDWDDFMRLASGCYELTGLGYIGVDLVLDKDEGAMMLEINARPGLNIQIANDDGLERRCRVVEKHLAQREQAKQPFESVADRVRFSQQHFGSHLLDEVVS
ncbi:MAG TPA: alpha-L-glutamate ligase-like protein [Alcanivoracaceae bacterium]|nr:alpha-L-glutamate ligase-like protein [Alcanivoracaceae bacterium]